MVSLHVGRRLEDHEAELQNQYRFAAGVEGQPLQVVQNPPAMVVVKQPLQVV